jgi:hypothetical protein
MSTPPPPTSHPSRRLWLWSAVTVPVLAWAAQGSVSVVMVSRACTRARPDAASMAVIVATGIGLSLSLGALWIGAMMRRRTARAPVDPWMRAERLDQDAMLALVGVLCSIAFTLGIAANGLPALLLRDLCKVWR